MKGLKSYSWWSTSQEGFFWGPVSVNTFVFKWHEQGVLEKLLPQQFCYIKDSCIEYFTPHFWSMLFFWKSRDISDQLSQVILSDVTWGKAVGWLWTLYILEWLSLGIWDWHNYQASAPKALYNPNCVRTSVARYRAALKRWGLANSASCESGDPSQMVERIITKTQWKTWFWSTWTMTRINGAKV